MAIAPSDDDGAQGTSAHDTDESQSVKNSAQVADFYDGYQIFRYTTDIGQIKDALTTISGISLGTQTVRFLGNNQHT